MALRFLIDTNIVSEIIRPRPNAQVVELWEAHQATIALAATTWHELRYGIERMPQSKRRAKLSDFVDMIEDRIPVLSYDQAAADWFGRERARLIALGRTPSFADGQIAATAATNDLTLVSRNLMDYADYVGLKSENWFE